MMCSWQSLSRALEEAAMRRGKEENFSLPFPKGMDLQKLEPVSYLPLLLV
jgi:hypothetical protein